MIDWHALRHATVATWIALVGCAPTTQTKPSPPHHKSTPSSGCTASELFVVVLCTPKADGTTPSPQLLGPGGKAERCVQSEEPSLDVARLEANIDTQGRLARVRVAKSGKVCDMPCMDATFGRVFQPSIREGRSISGEVTLLCRRRVDGTRSGPTKS